MIQSYNYLVMLRYGIVKGTVVVTDFKFAFWMASTQVLGKVYVLYLFFARRVLYGVSYIYKSSF